MSIRIIDHNGKVHQPSAHVLAAFQTELRRIGELPIPTTATVNLWVTNQSPEQLLETLKRMPSRPAATNGRETQMLPSETPVPDDDSNESSAAAPLPTPHPSGVTMAASSQVANTNPGDQGAPPPSKKSLYELGVEELQKQTVFNSVYQRETGKIFADPGGPGQLVCLEDGRIINLSDEFLKHCEEKAKRAGGASSKSAEG